VNIFSFADGVPKHEYFSGSLSAQRVLGEEKSLKRKNIYRNKLKAIFLLSVTKDLICDKV